MPCAYGELLRPRIFCFIIGTPVPRRGPPGPRGIVPSIIHPRRGAIGPQRHGSKLFLTYLPFFLPISAILHSCVHHYPQVVFNHYPSMFSYYPLSVFNNSAFMFSPLSPGCFQPFSLGCFGYPWHPWCPCYP